jgi:transcriptional regulator with XRE-family HTH domain
MKKQADLIKLVKVFTERLRARRKAMGLTQEQLAERSDFSTNYIARLELGTSIPSLSTLTRLSKALRIEIQDLLANEIQSTSSDDICATLLSSLDDREIEYVLSQLRNTIDFVLELRKIKQADKQD